MATPPPRAAHPRKPSTQPPLAPSRRVRPWARFRLTSEEAPAESAHLYFRKSVNRIGREPALVDHCIDQFYISKVNCVVALERLQDDGAPVVTLRDMSRNGMFVNGQLVGAPNSAVLEDGVTVHFTKPGLRSKTTRPLVFRFELLRDGLTPENNALRSQLDAPAARAQTPPVAAVAAAPAPSPSRQATPPIATTPSSTTSVTPSLPGARAPAPARSAPAPAAPPAPAASHRSSSSSPDSPGKRQREAASSDRAPSAGAATTAAPAAGDTGSPAHPKRRHITSRSSPAASTHDAEGLRNMTRQVQVALDRAEKAQNERNEARARCTELERTLQQRINELEARTAELSDCQRELQTTERDRQALDDSVQQYRQQIQRLTTENSSLRSTVRSSGLAQPSGNSLEDMRLRLSRAEQKVALMQRDMQQSIHYSQLMAKCLSPHLVAVTQAPIAEVLNDLGNVSQTSLLSSDRGSEPTPMDSQGLDSDPHSMEYPAVAVVTNGPRTVTAQSEVPPSTQESAAPAAPPVEAEAEADAEAEGTHSSSHGGSSGSSGSGSLPPRVAHSDSTDVNAAAAAAGGAEQPAEQPSRQSPPDDWVDVQADLSRTDSRGDVSIEEETELSPAS